MTCAHHCEKLNILGLAQVEKKNDTDVRRKIEEAMTAAKVRQHRDHASDWIYILSHMELLLRFQIRTCAKPGCKSTFVKAEGCNKITCAVS